MHARRLSSLLILSLLGCGDGPMPFDGGTSDGGLPVDAPVGDAGPREVSFEILDEQMGTVFGVSRRLELIRVNRADGERTYLIYVHGQVEPAPLVIVNQPYAGIDWTGEEVDTRWAALGDGPHPDVDAPDYDGDDQTTYTAQTTQAAAEDAGIWLINGAAVIEVYGRYYAGGDLLDDARDAAMAYAFAASRESELRLDRIGSYGASWGGMMALFGAALSEGAHPLVVSAVAPPSDFLDLYQHTDVDLPASFPNPAQAEAFFSPYWRRAAPAIGHPPSASDPRALAFTAAGLCDALPDRVRVLHDDWDLLVPARQTESLVAACGSKISPVFWRRPGLPYETLPLDHGPFNSEPMAQSSITFASLHLLHAILDPAAPRLTIGHGPALEQFLTLVRDAREGGEDVTFALAPLRDVAHPQVQLFDPGADAFVDGATLLAVPFNAVFGTSFDGAGLRAQLEIGLP